MKNLRSMLFMPGNNAGMLVSADNLGADAVIYDLEDAVSLEEKDAARDLVYNALTHIPFNHSYVTVRMNPIDYPHWEKDLEMILDADPDGLVIPKASVESLNTVEDYCNNYWDEHEVAEEERTLRFFMLVESAFGISQVEEIAQASDRVDGLLLGGEDYSVSMGVARTEDSKELEYARFRLATAARAYGLDAIDTPYTDIDNTAGLIKDTEFVKGIGFNGRLIINPRQIPAVHKILSPSQDQIEESLAILAAAKEAREKGLGVFSFKGKMVDKPVISRSENLVKSAKDWGLI